MAAAINPDPGLVLDEPELLNLNEDTILKMIKQKHPKLDLSEKVGGRSPMWAHFLVARVSGKDTKFVVCKHCKKVFEYDPVKKGTRSLTSHGQAHEKKSDEVPMKQLLIGEVPARSSNAPKLSEAEKVKVNQEVVFGLAIAHRPLSSVENEGFRLICQTMVNLGSRYKNINIDQVLQSRKTLSTSRLQEVQLKSFSAVKSSIVSAPSFPKYSFTFDLWSDKHSLRSFLSVSAHYFDAESILRAPCLSLIEMDESKTKDNNKERILRVLELYWDDVDAESVFKNSKSVTDSGSNVKTVFPERLPCISHKIHNVMDATFKFKKAREFSGKVEATLKTLKSIVTTFKKAGLNKELMKKEGGTTLKQEVSTRWNSIYIMVKSIQRNFDGVIEISGLPVNKKHKLDQKMKTVDKAFLDQLIDLLEPFYLVTEKLSSEKKPTLQLVAVLLHALLDHVQEMKTNELLLHLPEALLTTLEEQCNEYLVIQELHYVAAVLDPRLNQLVFVAQSTRDRIYALLRKLVSAEMGGVSASSNNDPTQPPPPSKRPRSRYENTPKPPPAVAPEDEVTRYLRKDFGDLPPVFKENSAWKINDEFDIMNFWAQRTDLPGLQRVSQWLLAVAASSATDERVFSSAGAIMGVRRTSLSGSTLGDLVYIFKNYKI